MEQTTKKENSKFTLRKLSEKEMESRMTIYSIDWSHKVEKTSVYSDGEIFENIPEFVNGDIVATENMPHHKRVELHHAGVTVYTCNTDLTKTVRDREGIEKTDDNDAIIIYNTFMDWLNTQDETFRVFTYSIDLEELSYQVKVRAEAVEARKKAKQRTKLDPILAGLMVEEVKESVNYVGRLETKIKRKLKTFPIYSEYLADLKGVGELITIIKDIERFGTVSKLWAYFGLDVRNGKAPKRKAGQTANWSHRGRCLVLNDIVSNGFKMCGASTKNTDGSIKKEASMWRQKYDAYKEHELAKNELREEEDKISKGHMDNRAIRKTGKEFLKLLYLKWKEDNKHARVSNTDKE
jgi:hypothetical protein